MMVDKQAYLPGKRRISLECSLSGRILRTRVRASGDLRRYFQRWHFDLSYDHEIQATEGVLNIPGVALLIPLAWMTGSDLHVDCLDRTFADTIEVLRKAYSRIYPKMPFSTRLSVDRLVDSPPNPEGSALLFSGGLDATYAFFGNRRRKPLLIEVFGTEFPCTNTKFCDRVARESKAFADTHGVDISFINTDFHFLLDQRALQHSFLPVRELVHGDLWKGMGYSLGFLGMTAPLSTGRFNHLIIAAAADKEHADRMRENPDSSSPQVDEKIKWSNLGVEHYGCLHRFEKVQHMKDWLPGNHLRVCWSFTRAQKIEGAMNCNRCEKCARSILALAIGGVDPAQCGFVIDEGTIGYMRERLVNRVASQSHLAFWYGPMQRAIPETIEGDMFGLAGFMEWFRDFDLGNGLDPRPPLVSIEQLYALFPYPVALVVRSLVYGVKGEPNWRVVGKKRARKLPGFSSSPDTGFN